MSKIEEEVGRLLREYSERTGRFFTIGTIESATGGRVADKITNVPGSSDYYKGSVISYSNEAKISIVGVQENTIKTYGAVSPRTAVEMAEGGRNLLNADICLSVTGIAGPSGVTASKPKGLFYFGLASKDYSVSTKHQFAGSREDIKQKATEHALSTMREFIVKFLSDNDNKELEEKHVVTVFLEHGNMILILRRSSRVGTYKRSWAGVSGYLETNELDQAYTELREETNLYREDVKVTKKGTPIEVIDRNLNRKWIVHPFLFHVKEPDKIRTDWEHTEVKWIRPEELSRYKVVPGLREAYLSASK